MKALSIWQPWASLIATGAKRYETRSWSTKYRGPLLICAAVIGRKRVLKLEIEMLLGQGEFRAGLAPLQGLPLGLHPRTAPSVSLNSLPFGKAVAVVDIVDCLCTDDMTRTQVGYDLPFGDFTLGRFAWKLENVRAFKSPFPIKGTQRLFEVDDKLIEEALCR